MLPILRSVLGGLLALVGFIGFIVLLGVLPMAVPELVAQLHAPVDAVVVSSELVPDGPDSGNRCRHRPLVRYRYTWEGKELTGEDLYPQNQVGYSHRQVVAKVRRYRAGDTIQAWVARWNPSVACVERAKPFEMVALLGWALLLLAVGGLGARRCFRSAAPPPAGADPLPLGEPVRVAYQLTFEQLRAPMVVHVTRRLRWLRMLLIWTLAFSALSVVQGIPLPHTGLVLLPLLLLLPWIVHRQWRRHFESRSDRDARIEITITDDSIQVSSKDSASTFNWRVLTGAVVAAHGYLLYVNADTYYWLPRAAFETPGDAERLERVLRSRLAVE